MEVKTCGNVQRKHPCINDLTSVILSSVHCSYNIGHLHDIDVLKQWPRKVFSKSVECSKSSGCFYRGEKYSPVLTNTAPVSDVLDVFRVRLQALVSCSTKHLLLSYQIMKITHEGL